MTTPSTKYSTHSITQGLITFSHVHRIELGHSHHALPKFAMLWHNSNLNNNKCLSTLQKFEIRGKLKLNINECYQWYTACFSSLFRSSKELRIQFHVVANRIISSKLYLVNLPSVLWRCWLGGKDIWPVKNWVVRYWRGYLSGSRCKWFSYGPADATATPSSLAPVKSRMVYLSSASLPRLSWKKAVKRM